MELTAFKEKLFAEAGAYGFTDWEIYCDRGASFEVQIFQGKINQYKNAAPVGLSFRGTYRGRVGYAFTEHVDEALIPSILKNAAENAGIIEETEIERLYPGDSEYPAVDAYHPALNDVSVQQKIDLALAMEKAAYAADPRVVSVDYCALGSGEGETFIANSLGLDLRHRANHGLAYVHARVEENGKTKLAGEIWHGRDWAELSPEALAKKAVTKAIAMLSAESCASAPRPVVFNNETACYLLTTFSSIFFAERVQKGFSLLKGKTGQPVAANCLTIRDDGVCEKSMGSVPFDCEGVATQNKALIENGILKTCLYNLKSAEKDGVSSTGNGFKPSFRVGVSTAATNLYAVPSDKSPGELMAMAKDGLYITGLSGLHAGANVISGDFSLKAEGFLIEDGKIGRAVEQIVVAGNFYQLLKDVLAVGNDLWFDLPSSMGTVGMPSILVSRLDVTGL